ncbi:MAG: TonB-dependent receptor, partial [Maribacter sp.]|nr:TonB-dependent receptor [Maribacter sp.]
YYDNLYADVGAVKENLKLPSYNILDLGLTYRMAVGAEKTKSIKIRANNNNILDTEYISRLSTANFAEAGDETYNGLAVSNRGYFGWGRTWNLTLRYNF